MGIYQCFLAVTLTLFIILMFIKILKNKSEFRGIMKIIVRFIITVVIGVIKKMQISPHKDSVKVINGVMVVKFTNNSPMPQI